jgi:hypothetical protein
MAQELPRPFASSGLSGQLVDSVTGRPLEGVVVVVRWNWERYYAGGWHSGPHFEDEGEVLAIHEAVTGPEGRYEIPAWGPVVRAMGQMQYDAPALFAFKAGYEPVSLRGKASGGTIRMKPAAEPAEELAKRISEMQGRSRGGLHWLYPNDVWKAMPRMILALHREKVRLGEGGRYILGANLLNNRSGAGTLLMPRMDERIQATHGSPILPAVVNVTWQIRSNDGRTVRRLVQQKKAPAGSKSGFWVSPWRFPQPGPPGWSADVDSAPAVRVYAANYHASGDVRWPEAGTTIALEPLPETREGRLEELKRWRRDIDRELEMGDRAEAAASQLPLIWLFVQECRRLTLDARAGICYDDDSPLVRSVATRPAALEWNVTENSMGGSDIRSTFAVGATKSTIEARSVKTEYPKDDKKPVSGFTIGPAGAPSAGRTK